MEPSLQLVQKAEYELITLALGRLSPMDQELLRLSLWDELAQAEIAELTGFSRPAVKQRLHRARKRLAKQYERLNTQLAGQRRDDR